MNQLKTFKILDEEFVNESVIKLSSDGCYAKSTQDAFSGFSISLADTGYFFSFCI